jgi:hypothetical protein
VPTRRDSGSCARRMSSVRRVLGALAVSLLLAGCGGSHHALRLRRSPYFGLACSRVAVHRCDRVGLAVWLARPATGVTAVADGVSVRLRTHSRGTGSYRRHLFWQGFFRDPRASRLADHSHSIPIRVSVTAPDGSVSTGTRTIYVSEGYG